MITVDSYTIIDLWNSVKPYIQQKDKQIAAESFVGILNEAGVLDNVVGDDSIDKFLSNAMQDLVGYEEEDEEEY